MSVKFPGVCAVWLLASCTVIEPVVAPLGTFTSRCESSAPGQNSGASVPLKSTESTSERLVPVSSTVAPT